MDFSALVDNVREHKQIVLATGASIAAAAMAYFAFRKPRKTEESKESLPQGLWTPLFNSEKGMIDYDLPAISTIFWYRGDIQQARKHIETKLKEVCDANLWLCGEIRKVNESWSLVFGESYNPEVFTVLTQEESQIARSTPLNDLYSLCEKCYVGKGEGARKRPFKVTLVPSKEDDGCYAMIVSMNHGMADGNTYYSVVNQLSADAPVISLNAVRDVELHDKINEVIGKEESENMNGSGIMLSFLTGLLWTKLARVKLKSVYYQINDSAIKEAKKETDGVPYVSTNDILLSWLFSVTGVNFHMMAINMRNRVEGLTESLAGYYSSNLLYRAADAKTPSLIRKSIINMCRASVPKTPLPSTMELLVWDRMWTMSTNWASFSKPLKIPGSEEELHVPLADASSMFSNMVFACIFRRKGSELGLWLVCRDEYAKKIEGGKLLGPEIN